MENPVQRNDAVGPWKRFNSGKFPDHGSMWQRKCVIKTARITGGRVVHVPMGSATTTTNHCRLSHLTRAVRVHEKGMMVRGVARGGVVDVRHVVQDPFVRDEDEHVGDK